MYLINVSDGTKTLFANESLTPLRRKMYTALRMMRKKAPEVVKGCTSMDGKIFAFTSPTAPNGCDQKHHIEDWEALQNFCRDFVKWPLDSFLHEMAAH